MHVSTPLSRVGRDETKEVDKCLTLCIAIYLYHNYATTSSHVILVCIALPVNK